MNNDLFPYTETYSFSKIVDVAGGFIQVCPPSNWNDGADYHGFYTMPSEYATRIRFFEEGNDDEKLLKFVDGTTFYINYNEKKIYFILGTITPDSN